jgi:hypothetical protein
MFCKGRAPAPPREKGAKAAQKTGGSWPYVRTRQLSARVGGGRAKPRAHPPCAPLVQQHLSLLQSASSAPPIPPPHPPPAFPCPPP